MTDILIAIAITWLGLSIILGISLGRIIAQADQQQGDTQSDRLRGGLDSSQFHSTGDSRG